ncbi:MAG: ATP phosphoribosyltransferase [bacterium]|jgi:ATP phosphoribosyltransferase|nr:ATP phosphoribosyltransferase [bacterium]
MTKKLLKLGLPKGSLQNSTFDLFRKAGYKVTVRDRSYYPDVNDPELSIVLLRAQEMSRYVEDGSLDAGITGYDWILENDSDVEIISTLCYSKATSRPVRWVLAAPEDSDIHTVKDLEGKRIATELVNASRRYLQEHGVNAEVEFSWGATEVKVPNLVDAIIDVTETGSSLRANKLKIVETLFESQTKLCMNKTAFTDPWKREKVARIALLLEGAICAEDKVGLKMNVRKEDLEKVLRVLPKGLTNPTVSSLYDGEWSALEIIVDENTVREIVPPLKQAGAVGIIEYPLNKVIY